MADVVLRAESLSKSYVDGGVRAVDGIELSVRAGEFVNIMGSSGSGKTTLLYLLAGLERPSDGSVWVDENRIDQLGANELARLRRNSIGFVFQSMNLLPHLSLRENILVAGYLTARPRSEVQLTADRLLQEMGISDAAHRLPAEVSIGQQQRAAIGRALVNSPRMVFADEPTGSLNSSASAGVLDLLEAVNRAGTTVVMVTHDLKAACRGKRVLFIRDGQVEGQFDFEGEHCAAAAHRLPAEVSIGQQQRAAIGRALVNSPRMVFADEPTGSLNSSASAGVLDLLEAVNRAGTTVVMVTHDLKAACRGKRVLFIRDGRVEGQFDFESEHGVESEHGIGSEHRAAAEDREKRLCEWLFEKGW